MRVKGRYVATIEVDIDYDDESEDSFTFEDARFILCGDSLKHNIASVLQRYVFDIMSCKLTINEQYKDLYCLPDET